LLPEETVRHRNGDGFVVEVEGMKSKPKQDCKEVVQCGLGLVLDSIQVARHAERSRGIATAVSQSFATLTFGLTMQTDASAALD
jgi:hypothetical protein